MSDQFDFSTAFRNPSAATKHEAAIGRAMKDEAWGIKQAEQSQRFGRKGSGHDYRSKILGALQNGISSAAQIAEAANMDVEWCRQNLNDMERRGVIKGQREYKGAPFVWMLP